MADKVATREAYGKALAEFGADKDIVVLDADLSKSTMTNEFKKVYPERFVNMGIAEANMMDVAAGISTCGKTVFASSFAIFAAGRAWEQIRNTICYPSLNVKVGATHAGISVGEDGASHQCVEDLAIMRVLPNMRVISPCDAVSARWAVKAAIDNPGPFYLRFGRLAVGKVHGDDAGFELGKGIRLRDGDDVTIMATGLMVHEALLAHEILKGKGIAARVVDMHTIKPLDEGMVEACARETGAIVTCEEHSVMGGFGGAVAEAVCRRFPVPMRMVGIMDRFGKSGKPQRLMEMYGLTASDVAGAAAELAAAKGGR